MLNSGMDRDRWDKSNSMSFKVIKGQGQGHNETHRTHMLNSGMDRGRWDKSNNIKLKVIRGLGHDKSQRSHMLNSGIDRARWDKSNNISFKVIKGQGQGHEAVNFAKVVDFNDRRSPPLFRGFEARTGYVHFLTFWEKHFYVIWISVSFSFCGTLNLFRTAFPADLQRR